MQDLLGIFALMVYLIHVSVKILLGTQPPAQNCCPLKTRVYRFLLPVFLRTFIPVLKRKMTNTRSIMEERYNICSTLVIPGKSTSLPIGGTLLLGRSYRIPRYPYLGSNCVIWDSPRIASLLCLILCKGLQTRVRMHSSGAPPSLFRLGFALFFFLFLVGFSFWFYFSFIIDFLDLSCLLVMCRPVAVLLLKPAFSNGLHAKCALVNHGTCSLHIVISTPC